MQRESSAAEEGNTKRDVDLIVSAAGFDASPLHHFPVYGLEGPQALGPLVRVAQARTISQLGRRRISQLCSWAGNLLPSIEGFANYTGKMQRENILRMMRKMEAVKGFARFCERYFEGTVSGEGCKSRYKAGLGAEQRRGGMRQIGEGEGDSVVAGEQSACDERTGRGRGGRTGSMSL